MFVAFGRITEQSRGTRRLGSAALDLAYVACGRLDGFWEMGLRPWDVATGHLLVEEAGGAVTRFDGSPHRLAGGEILAAPPGLDPKMGRILATCSGWRRRGGSASTPLRRARWPWAARRQS